MGNCNSCHSSTWETIFFTPRISSYSEKSRRLEPRDGNHALFKRNSENKTKAAQNKWFSCHGESGSSLSSGLQLGTQSTLATAGSTHLRTLITRKNSARNLKKKCFYYYSKTPLENLTT